VEYRAAIDVYSIFIVLDSLLCLYSVRSIVLEIGRCFIIQLST